MDLWAALRSPITGVILAFAFGAASLAGRLSASAATGLVWVASVLTVAAVLRVPQLVALPVFPRVLWIMLASSLVALGGYYYNEWLAAKRESPASAAPSPAPTAPPAPAPTATEIGPRAEAATVERERRDIAERERRIAERERRLAEERTRLTDSARDVAAVRARARGTVNRLSSAYAAWQEHTQFMISDRPPSPGKIQWLNDGLQRTINDAGLATAAAAARDELLGQLKRLPKRPYDVDRAYRELAEQPGASPSGSPAWHAARVVIEDLEQLLAAFDAEHPAS